MVVSNHRKNPKKKLKNLLQTYYPLQQVRDNTQVYINVPHQHIKKTSVIIIIKQIRNINIEPD